MATSKESNENAVEIVRGLFDNTNKAAQQYDASEIGQKRKSEIKAGKKPKVFVCFGDSGKCLNPE